MACPRAWLRTPSICSVRRRERIEPALRLSPQAARAPPALRQLSPALDDPVAAAGRTTASSCAIRDAALASSARWPRARPAAPPAPRRAAASASSTSLGRYPNSDLLNPSPAMPGTLGPASDGRLSAGRQRDCHLGSRRRLTGGRGARECRREARARHAMTAECAGSLALSREQRGAARGSAEHRAEGAAPRRRAETRSARRRSGAANPRRGRGGAEVAPASQGTTPRYQSVVLVSPIPTPFGAGRPGSRWFRSKHTTRANASAHITQRFRPSRPVR